MKTRRTLTVLHLTAAMLLASPLLGCQSSHKQWKSDADQRWMNLRSTALLQMAKDQFEAGAIDTADKTVHDAAAIDANNPQLHLLAGRIALERGQLERAYRLFEMSATLNERQPDAYYYQGVVLQRWQQFDAAHAAYQKAYDLDPSSAQRMLAVAEMLVELDRVDDAVALLEDKKYYFDQNAGCRAMLGHLYTMKQEYALATENFRQAVMLSPENFRLQEELGLAQVANGAFADAVVTLEPLLKQDGYAKRYDLMRSLATAEAELGRDNAARDIYIKLTRADPTNANDWIRLGELCWKTQDLGGALIAANRAITLSPQRHEGYLLAGMVWQKRGRVEDALEMFDRAAALAPAGDATPLILRGLSLQKADRFAAAAEAYSEALKRNPDDKRAERLLAQVQTN